jgi:hypothetical protein
MIVAMVIVNAVFAVLVVGGMLALHGWAIATDAGRQPRVVRARRTRRTRQLALRPDLATQ